MVFVDTLLLVSLDYEVIDESVRILVLGLVLLREILETLFFESKLDLFIAERDLFLLARAEGFFFYSKLTCLLSLMLSIDSKETSCCCFCIGESFS